MKQRWNKITAFFRTRTGIIAFIATTLLTVFGLIIAFLDYADIPLKRQPTPTITLSPFIELVEMTSSVESGSGASISVRTLPGSTCHIIYTTPAGNISSVDILTPEIANSVGLCTWSWHISKNTQPGPGEISIRVDDLEVKYPISILAAPTIETRAEALSSENPLDASPILPPVFDEFDCVPRDTQRVSGLVTNVVDGNTIDVQVEDGEVIRIHYLGVATPEYGHPWAADSKAINEKLVLGKDVILVNEHFDTNDNGNVLRYVFTEDTFINFDIISHGYGFTASDLPGYSCQGMFIEHEAAAAESDRGFNSNLSALGEDFSSHPLFSYPTPTPETTTAKTETECIPKEAQPQMGLVIDVIDGDTIEVQLENGETVQVRYIGIDSPERDEPLYAETSKFNRDLVMGKNVLMYKDVSEVDKYGRLLRYLSVDGIFVNYEMIVQGLALPAEYPPDTSCAVEFTRASESAKESKLGLWKFVEP